MRIAPLCARAYGIVAFDLEQDDLQIINGSTTTITRIDLIPNTTATALGTPLPDTGRRVAITMINSTSPLLIAPTGWTGTLRMPPADTHMHACCRDKCTHDRHAHACATDKCVDALTTHLLHVWLNHVLTPPLCCASPAQARSTLQPRLPLQTRRTTAWSLAHWAALAPTVSS